MNGPPRVVNKRTSVVFSERRWLAFVLIQLTNLAQSSFKLFGSLCCVVDVGIGIQLY